MKNQFQVLVGAEAFMKAFRQALADCHTSLYIQFSTFEGDTSGQALADLLLEKAAQGVEVRLMLDYYSDVVMSDVYPFLLHRRHEVAAEFAQTRALIAHLRQAGVHIQRTAPPGFLGRFMLYRDHKKMILMDGETAFVGGINISDHNYAWHDFMVKIQGQLVKDLSQDFLSTWAGETQAFDELSAKGDYVVNQCAGRYSIWEGILGMIQDAQTTLVIESPYLLGDRMEGAIGEAAERGVQVQLILPYLSNKWIYRWWVQNLRHHLIHPNIQIYGYQGKHNMTHAKLVLVDGKRASFGSFNMFELEGLTQKELNIFTDNPACLAQLENLIQTDLADSVLLPPPPFASERWSYKLAYHFFEVWTAQLLQNPVWCAKYC